MHSSNLLLALAAIAPSAAEDVLGVYIFHRHGDRTAKAWKPVNMTALGAQQVHAAGSYYRSRYVDSDASLKVQGLSSDIAVLSQMTITSPIDPVLHNSAVVFLQGLYPPTGLSETLANGTRVEAPLDGYQYIPVDAIDDAATANKAESTAWLQGGSGCSKAELSSNSYFSSAAYLETSEQSADFYTRLIPVVNSSLPDDEINFKNGYSVFDLINVARVHNASIPSEDLLNEDTVDELYNLASIHEWNLAYNQSEPERSIAGSVLAGQIIDSLEAIVDGTSSAPPMNIQFGAYGTFMAFFGLAKLQDANPDFMGITDYSSSMTFELVTNATDPAPEDISVRFFYSNGTASDDSLQPFPLFGGEESMISWADFKSGMNDFAIHDDQHWCEVCGVTDGQCASSSSEDDNASSESCESDGGISKPVAGVIGALVTLVVILGVQAAVMILGGFRFVKKSALTRGPATSEALKA